MTNFEKHISITRILLHCLFWITWMGGFALLQSFGYGFDAFADWMVYYVVTLPLFMGHTYAIAYWLVPSYFFKGRYLLFSSAIFVFLVLASIGELVLSNELVWRLVKPENIQQGNYLNWQNVLINGIGNEYIVIVFLAVKVIKLWDSKVQEKTELVNRKLATEIELLQYQSYPRFVLNVMERLEQLAQLESKQTSEMIIRLSNLMSSMISIRKTEKILLHKEIEMIKSYIDIQRMKLPNEFGVNLLTTGEFNSIKIPPFLFFQLVEEGFVAAGDGLRNTDFTVLIKAEPSYLLFSLTLWNTDSLNKPFNKTVLENCRKYLSYFYPENHKVMSDFEINFVEITIEIYL